MSATTSQTHNGPRTYGNWTKPKTPGLLGLGAIGTGVLFVGAGVTIVVSIIGGLLAVPGHEVGGVSGLVKGENLRA